MSNPISDKDRKQDGQAPKTEEKTRCGCKGSTNSAPDMSAWSKVYHVKPHAQEKAVADVYAGLDNDLGRDNLENDLTAADIQDL